MEFIKRNFNSILIAVLFLVFGVIVGSHLASADEPKPTPVASPSPKIGLPNGYVPFYEPIEKILPGKKDARKKTQKAMGINAKETFTDTKGVDYSKFDLPVLSQFRGDCTTHGMATVVENLVRRNADPTADYSQASLWSWQNAVANVDAAISAAKGNYVKPEAGWPYGKAMVIPQVAGRYKVTGISYLGDENTASIGKKIITALDNGLPIYWGGSVSKDMSACSAKIRPNTGHTSGGHSVGIIGYKVEQGELWMKLKNHWTAQCGEKGYQWLSLSSCQKGYCLFYAVSEVEDKVTGKKISVVKPTPSPTVTPTPSPSIIKQVIDGKTYECKEAA